MEKELNNKKIKMLRVKPVLCRGLSGGESVSGFPKCSYAGEYRQKHEVCKSQQDGLGHSHMIPESQKGHTADSSTGEEGGCPGEGQRVWGQNLYHLCYLYSQ